MATIHMSEAELARNIHEVLAQVQQGIEVVIEQDQRPVAILKHAGAPSVARRSVDLEKVRQLLAAVDSKRPLGPRLFTADDLYDERGLPK